MVQLSLDVLPSVMARLYREDVANGARVSRTWLDPVRHSLYSHLFADEYYSTKSLIAALTKYAHLRFLVKRVSISLNQPHPNPDFIPIDSDFFLRLLTLVPDLLELEVDNLVTFTPDYEKALGKLTKLERFVVGVSSAQELDEFRGEPFARALARWPALRSIELKGCQFKAHDWAPATKCPVKLANLDLLAVQLADNELEWLVSASRDSLHTLTYVEWKLPRYTETLSRLFSLMSSAPAPPPNPATRLTDAGMVRILAPLDLAELRLGAENLTPAGLNKILSRQGSLRHLAVPFGAIGSQGVEAASASLRTLQLYQLPSSDVVTEEATRKAIQHLQSCPLGGVKTLVISKIKSGKLYDRALDDINAIGQVRGLTVVREDRYFH